MSNLSENTSMFLQSGVDDPNFAYDLLTELTRTFLAYADDVRAQDSAAYAIQVPTGATLTPKWCTPTIFGLCPQLVFLMLHQPQELLSIFECREGRTDSPGRRLWRRFPEQIQEILEPHLNSRCPALLKKTCRKSKFILSFVVPSLLSPPSLSSGIRAVRRR